MEQGQKVEVISVCDTGGGLRPLRFRFEGEDHQLHRVDIDQVPQHPGGVLRGH